jgi:hypothetical protein
MKITKQKLVKIIKEELEAALEESDETDYQKAYEAARKEIELYSDIEPTPEQIKAQMLKTSKGGLGAKPNKDGIDF